MNPTTHLKALYILSAVSLVLIGYLLHQNLQLSATIHSGSQMTTQALGSTTKTDPLAGITVGSTKAAPYASGLLTAITPNSIVVKNTQTGATQTVAITASTKVKIDGAQKDVATQQNEMAAYNAQVTELIKDPVKNKAALAAMQLPTTQIISDGSMSDLAVGDSVYVILSDTASTPTAVVIHKDTLNTTLR